MNRSSVRSQILAGAALSAVGLFGGVFVVWGLILVHSPRHVGFVHRTMLAHAHVVWIAIALAVLAGLLVVRRAVAPLSRLRERLAAVRSGQEPRIAGEYPAEVQPLVDELNALLAHQEQSVRRAVAKAGDLAHGLKTPLAVLAHDAERARAAGQVALADGVREQIDRMQRQVDYHLAQARAVASGATPGAITAVREAVDGVVRALERLHADRGLLFDVDVDPRHRVRVQREDLDEMLGNLFDNACKWTRSRVAVRTTSDEGEVRISVEDDGPGVPAALRERVLGRGVRADEAAPGAGFGLAIVRDLAELYDGAIMLERSSSGGLRAILRLPAAP